MGYKTKMCRNFKNTFNTSIRYLPVVGCMWQIHSAINIWLTLHGSVNIAPLIVEDSSLSTFSSSLWSTKRAPPGPDPDHLSLDLSASPSPYVSRFCPPTKFSLTSRRERPTTLYVIRAKRVSNWYRYIPQKKSVRLPVCTRVRLILVLVWKKLSWF